MPDGCSGTNSSRSGSTTESSTARYSVILGLEVAVHDQAGHARLLGNRLHRRAVEAARQEGRSSGADESGHVARHGSSGEHRQLALIDICIHECLLLSMKFGIFYEHQIGRPWDDDTDHRLIRTHSTRSSSPTSSASSTSGRWSTTSSRSTATPRHPRCSSPPAVNAPPTSGSGTGSCSRRRSSTIRPGSPSGSRMLDLVSNGRVEFGSGESGSEAELGGFGIDPHAQARRLAGRARDGAALHGRDAVHGRRGRVRVDAAAQRRAQAGPEAAPAVVGRLQSPRDDPARPLSKGMGALDVRLHRPRGSGPTGSATTSEP